MRCFGKWRCKEPAPAGNVYSGLSYTGLAFLWLGISFGLKTMENTGCVFGFGAVGASKVLVIALLWIGRFYWFPEARLPSGAKLWCVFGGLLLAGSGLGRVTRQFSAFYLLLVGADTGLWVVVAAAILETLIAVYYQRVTLAVPRSSQLGEQWSLFWRDSLKLGAWLTLLLGLLFFYLVSFYHFDVFFYSRGLTVIWLGAELLFYGIAYWRLTSGLRTEINLLEREIAGYLGGPSAAPAELADRWLPVLQYLLLSREYLISRRRPVLSGWTLGALAVMAGFLLELPHLIGAVIKV